MSGNCATGSRVIAMRPASVMTIEMTKASRGRSMKTSEITALGPLAGRQHRDRDGLSDARLLDPIDDDLLALLQPVGDDDIAPVLRPGRDPPHLDLVVGVYDQHERAGLIELQGGLRDDQARLLV